jgi:hypothetical protein
MVLVVPELQSDDGMVVTAFGSVVVKVSPATVIVTPVTV